MSPATPQEPHTQRLLAAVLLPDLLAHRERREARAASAASDGQN